MFDFDFDELAEIDNNASSKKDLESFDVYAISDIHTDKPANMDLILSWPERPNDVLIVAGDISCDLDILRATFTALTARFGRVFFCPGNHDLWLHKDDGCKDSIEKIWKIEELCQELGVRTKPERIGNVLIVPILSWYHASFDQEPDIHDPSLLPVDMVMTDFMACRWPQGLTHKHGSDSVARFIDGLNDLVDREVPLVSDKDRHQTTMISFSHFLPRPELLPEKRLLYFPPLPKAVGSLALGHRVQKLSPDLHIFGHTHYGWSQELDGIKYLQACVAYPRERAERPFSVCCKDSTGEEASLPLLVYQSKLQGIPSYKAFWSEYYKAHPRTPDDLSWIYSPQRNPKAVTAAVERYVNETNGHVDDISISQFMRQR